MQTEHSTAAPLINGISPATCVHVIALRLEADKHKKAIQDAGTWLCTLCIWRIDPAVMRAPVDWLHFSHNEWAEVLGWSTDRTERALAVLKAAKVVEVRHLRTGLRSTGMRALQVRLAPGVVEALQAAPPPAPLARLMRRTAEAKGVEVV